MTAPLEAPRRVSRLGTGIRLGNYEPGTPEWSAARRRRIGGSEIAAVLGLSPWESPFSLWWRKQGALGPIPDSELLWWGREMEPVIAKRVAREHPESDVRRCATYVNKDRDYQLISPDRLLLARGGTGRWRVVEIKHAFDGEEWGDGPEDIPIYYRCQVIWAMDTLGVEEHYLAVYHGGGKYREYLIRYDEHDALILRKRAAEFMDTIERGDAPDIDGHAATYAAVQEMHPDIDGTDLDLPASIADPYLAALQAAQDAAEAKRRTSAEVITAMGQARRAIYGVKADGNPRSIATRIPGRGDSPPHLRANPLPKPKKEIA